MYIKRDGSVPRNVPPRPLQAIGYCWSVLGRAAPDVRAWITADPYVQLSMDDPMQDLQSLLEQIFLR